MNVRVFPLLFITLFYLCDVCVAAPRKKSGGNSDSVAAVEAKKISIERESRLDGQSLHLAITLYYNQSEATNLLTRYGWIWGGNGGSPKMGVEQIVIRADDQQVVIPAGAYIDLFDPNLLTSFMCAGDSLQKFTCTIAGGEDNFMYEAQLRFVDGKLVERAVSFFQDDEWWLLTQSADELSGEGPRGNPVARSILKTDYTCAIGKGWLYPETLIEESDPESN